MAHASSPIHAYALVWASHTLLQLCVQPFLFPLGLRSIICVANGALVLRPSRRTFTAALLLRNLARAVSAPFVWDSEFWLALTDAAALASMRCSAEPGALPHVGRWTRRQLAWCYAAAAFFKLNSSFLDARVSCAPIFGLSLLEYAPAAATWLADRPAAARALAAALPWSVIAAEAAIAALLAAGARPWQRRGVALALVFHLLIAITPPPNGVPTFSCVAAARLLLCVGDDARPAAAALGRVVEAARGKRAPLLLVGVLGFALLARRNSAIATFLVLMAFDALALCCADETAPHAAPPQLASTLLIAAAATYAFVLPILGLQEIGSCTMFANVRLVQGASNHVLGVPTGLLQARSDGVFSGGVVRVETTSSDYLNALYPGEITTLLAPQTRDLLRVIGHVARQFNPKARRVLGERIRARMPRWRAASGAPFVRYTVPALELRRLLAEARRAAAATNTTFDLTYTRLRPSAKEDEAWRAHARGVTVRLKHDDGRGNGECLSRDDAGGSRWATTLRGWNACSLTELALAPEPAAIALKLMLFYPYAILPEAPGELVCNY